MTGQLTKTQSNIDEKFNRRSTEQRRLIMEIIRQAEVRLAGYCPECQQRFSNNMIDTKQQVAERR